MMETKIDEKQRCPFGEKRCPVLAPSEQLNHCPLAMPEVVGGRKNGRICAFRYIAGKLGLLLDFVAAFDQRGIKLKK